MKVKDFIPGAIKGLILGIFGLFMFSFFGGTIVWLIWPIAIPAAFPQLVIEGYLAKELSWWGSICLVWLFGFLIRSGSGNTGGCPLKKEEEK